MNDLESLVGRAAATALPLFALAVFAPAAAAQCPSFEAAKIPSPDPQASSFFGWGLGLSGATAVIGAHGQNVSSADDGAAWIFERDLGGSGAWGMRSQLQRFDPQTNDQFGRDAAIDGDTAVVGSPFDDDLGSASGSAYVFERDFLGSDTWFQTAKLLASDGSTQDFFGTAVTISGDTVVVGAYFEQAVYVYERDAGGPDAWGQTARIDPHPGTSGIGFGIDVALSGDTLLVSTWQSGTFALAQVFGRDVGGPGAWGFVAELTGSDLQPFNVSQNVALSGTTAVLGATWDADQGADAGAVHVFERDQGGPNAWGKVAKIYAPQAAQYQRFGWGVAIDTDVLVVGKSGFGPGAVHAFGRHLGGTNAWGHVIELVASDGAQADGLGRWVDISGSTILAGAAWADSVGQGTGAAYVFEGLTPNVTTTYCTAKPTSVAGCLPAIGASGSPSASASSGFVISSGNVPGGNLGLYFYTHDGESLPAAGLYGTICIQVGTTFRSPSMPTGGTSGVCNGELSFDWNAYAQSVSLSDPLSTTPGSSVDGQFWYRDPPNVGGANFTDALGFLVCP